MKFPTEKHLDKFELDQFNGKNLSKIILDDIILKMELPNCFGVYGNWGSGKSTMLHFIMEHLKSKQKEYSGISVAYFESWKYEYSDDNDLLFALLNSIKESLDIDSKIWKSLMTDALVIGSGLLRKFGIVDVDKVEKDFDSLEDKIFAEHEQWIDKVEKFRGQFQKIVSDGLRKKKTSKLIIFIDDLDRCLPDNAVKLLEGIKNFLSVDKTLFVLAIDRRIISEMIGKRYGLHRGYGDEYLMKIIHYSYELPKNKQLKIITNILAAYEINSSPRQLAYINGFLNEFASEPRIVKNLVHQFCMNVIISTQAKLLIDSDKSAEQIQYLFVATFLIKKFPNYFLDSGSLGKLRSVRESAARVIRRESRTSRFEEDESIEPGDRKILENVLKHRITGQGDNNTDLTDTSKLLVALNAIKTYE